MAITGDPFSAFASSAGAGLGKGLADAIGGGGGPMTSGGAFDSRFNIDGSGWTVSTGSSRATGGARSGAGADLSGQPQMPIGQSPSLISAGFGNLGMLLIVGLALGFLMKKGKL